MIRATCQTTNCSRQGKVIRIQPGKLGCDVCGNSLKILSAADEVLHMQAVTRRRQEQREKGLIRW